MDRIFSARIDDKVVKQIDNLAKKMHYSKKSVIEKAIALLSQSFYEEQKTDVFTATNGAWQRNEKPEQQIKNIRNAFNQSMSRHHL